MKLTGQLHAQDEPSFELSFETPAEVHGDPGETVEIEGTAILTSFGLGEEDDGIQGWSLSMSSIGWDIIDVTLDGTAGAATTDDPPGLRSGGFDVQQLTTLSGSGTECEGRNGAVVAVVLSFSAPTTLPTTEPSAVAKLTLSGEVPPEEDGCEECSVEFADGCQGQGQPVDNKATLDGATQRPARVSATTRVCPIIRCDRPGKINISITDEAIDDDQHTNDSTDVPEEAAEISSEGRTGEKGSITVYANLIAIGLTDFADEPTGIQGWAIAGSVSGDAAPVSTSIEGTASAATPEGLFNGGFSVHEVVDPDELHADGDPQGKGFVSAAVLSFTSPAQLAPSGSGTGTILCVEIETIDDLPDGEVHATVTWRDGMRGSGQPVRNVATVDGNTKNLCSCQTANLTFIGIDEVPHLRCDPNSDGETNLADAVWIVSQLFRGGQIAECPDSADCNDDSSVDLSDALFATTYRFLGGEEPPAPFSETPHDDGACALDPTPDDLECTSHAFCNE